MQSVKDYTDQMHKLVLSCGSQYSSYKLVSDYGIDFVPFLRPPGMPKMMDKECFSNCAGLVLANDDLVYCEGYAKVEYMEFFILHAWLMLPDGTMLDPTWKTMGAAYRGIPFATEYLRRVMVESEMYGILDNYRWREIYTASPETFVHGSIYASIYQES